MKILSAIFAALLMYIPTPVLAQHQASPDAVKLCTEIAGLGEDVMLKRDKVPLDKMLEIINNNPQLTRQGKWFIQSMIIEAYNQPHYYGGQETVQSQAKDFGLQWGTHCLQLVWINGDAAFGD